MKTSLRLLVLTASIGAASGIYAGPGPAYWMHAKPAGEQAKVTSPSTDKAAVENTAPRPYERGIKPAVPRDAAACSCQS